jgi:hypothetical protein
MHAPSGIRTRDPNNQAAADPRLRPRGHWNRHPELLSRLYYSNLLTLYNSVVTILYHLLQKKELHFAHSVFTGFVCF